MNVGSAACIVVGDHLQCKDASCGCWCHDEHRLRELHKERTNEGNGRYVDEIERFQRRNADDAQ